MAEREIDEPSSALHVREADFADLPQILSIYNDVMTTSDAIFTEAPDTLEARTAWLEQRRADTYPVLVAERASSVAGFASYGPFRPWPGYRDTVEHSVHVGAEHRRHGVGRALLLALIDRARSASMHVMVAGIDGGNAASLEFHAALGFVRVGHLREVGRKQDRLLDLVFMQLTL